MDASALRLECVPISPLTSTHPSRLVRRAVALLAALVVAAGALVVLTPGPLRANTRGDVVQVATRDMAGYTDECVERAYRITPIADGSPDGSWSGSWSYRARLIHPGGKRDDEGSYSGRATSRTDTVLLCPGYDRFGTYWLEVRWSQRDVDGSTVASGTTTSRFTYTRLEKKPAKLTITKKPYGTNGWKFSTRLTRAGKPMARERVDLWFKWRGSWRDYEEPKRTNARGVATWHTARTLPPEVDQFTHWPFQVRYQGDARTKQARSPLFYLARRR